MNSFSTDPPGAVGGMPTSTRATATPGNVAMTIVMLFTLPPLVYYLWFCLAFNHGHFALPSAEMLQRFPLPTPASVAIVAAWLIFQGLLQIYAPGKWVKGPPLPDGTRLKYKMNGWFAWWVTWAVLAAGAAFGLYSPACLADQFGALLTTVNIFFTCLFLSVLAWQTVRDDAGTRYQQRGVRLLARHRPQSAHRQLRSEVFLRGAAGSHRLGRARPLVCRQAVRAHGFVSVADDPGLRVPFLVRRRLLLPRGSHPHDLGHQARELRLDAVLGGPGVGAVHLHHPGLLPGRARHDLPWWGTLGIVLLNIAGYVIFRGANIQKHRFRQGSETPGLGQARGVHQTARGSLLLTSGWWGLARHMNYFGDLLMALAWCLPCLFESPLPYFYMFYFTILLVHRERRDNDMCAVRYDKDWETYCAKVRYRIVPGLY